MQDAITLLAAAHEITLQLARERALRPTVAADRPEPWFVEAFGTPASRIESIDANIEQLRGRLGAIKFDLMSQGLTQADCKAIWQAHKATV